MTDQTSGGWAAPSGSAYEQEAVNRSSVSPASWFSRVWAALIDGLIGVAVYIPLAVLDSDSASVLFGISFLAYYVLYAPLMLTFNRGRTLGKMALGIRVINYDGDPIGFPRALMREVPVKWILGIIPLIDSLWPLWQKENRALHDLVAGTWVIDDR